ncbi:hypothetical protein KKA09_00980 [Patescibacteria group bacterium]|nr:hypothetical protein [Patescibacteria group bacterium]
MLNLAQRWRIGLWKLYQKDPEKFLRDYFDPDASIGSVKSDLLNYQSFERRFGFKTEEVGGYGNPEAKLRLKFDPKSQELNQQKRKILFVVDTNDIGDDKDVRYASYLLAKKIIEEWKKIGLPIREKFGNLSEEEEKEILEVEKDEEKLKELWLSLRIGYKEEDLEKWRKEEEEEKKEFGLK